ncbi:anti-sigma factor [Dyella solisilvae]|uniref:Anti-sigma factor n=1 Tax=Dyella solisilvae TaxID=1920168 RepID=A0A370KBJ6_9GAMM|nr:anti-sigma factor [Dyella solisilvae]RDJ00029.1 anti-sigma factor [Dyella solisilvae]
MTCDDTRLLLHAYLDDELDAANSAAVASHMRGCTGCTARYDAYATLHKALSQPVLYHRAPDALRQRLAAAPAASVPKPRSRAPLAWAMAAGFIGAQLLSSPAWFHWWRSSEMADPIVAQAVSAHVRSLQQQHLMDVVSTDQHTVKPWFEGKLDFSPRVKDLASEGFPLLGGRLDAIDGRSVAALVYKRRLHVINLSQWPDEGSASGPAIAREHGFTVIRWRADGMRFVAISDVNEGDLRQFVLAFQNEPGVPAAR